MIISNTVLANGQLSPRFWGFLWFFLNQRTDHDKISHEKNESPSYTFCQYFMNFCPLKHRLLRRKICRGQRHVLKKHRSWSIIAAPCWKYWFNVVFLCIYMYSSYLVNIKPKHSRFSWYKSFYSPKHVKARSHQRPDQPPLSPALEKWTDRQWAGLDRGERMLI